MTADVHSTAIVDPRAKLGRNVRIGPYCVVGSDVELGESCILHHHATVQGHTTLGPECEVFPQAVLGMPPQDVKFGGERTYLRIGAKNIFREMVTAHPGTGNGGGVTSIGEGNLFLIGVHVAHDCHIGNHCIIANYVQFAGHVHVEDHVNMGGHSAVHHFVTIGRHAFLGGMTRVAADVPPYMVVVAARGSRAEIRMVNGVGLERSGFSAEDIAALKGAFMKLFSRRARQSGTAIRDRVEEVLRTDPCNPHVRYLCESLLRSFAHGRHGRYLESLRADPIHRQSWRLSAGAKLTVEVIGRGHVQQEPDEDADSAGALVRLTAEAEPGWAFSGWNGTISGSRNPERIVLDSPKRVTATFTQVASG